MARPTKGSGDPAPLLGLVVLLLICCAGPGWGPGSTRSPIVRLFEVEKRATVGPRGDRRQALSVPVGTRVTETVRLPDGARLDWAVAARASGVRLKVEARVLLIDSESETVLSSQIVRARGRRPERWLEGRVELSRWGGRTVTLVLETRRVGGRRSGPSNPRATTFWASPRLTDPGGAPERRPSVLLVLIDTLRADRLGCYGNPRAVTPTIDRLASRGTLFENAFSQANWTLPSVASLFSGLYPSEHLVVGDKMRLAPHPSHLAPLMARNGYLTAGFHAGGYVGAHFGLAAGFDTYRTWKGFSEMERAVAWIERHGDVPFFLFLHTYDVHAPYGSVPEEYWRTFVGNAEVDARFLESKPHLMPRKEGGERVSERELDLLLKLHDGEVRFVDAQLGWLFEELERFGLTDDLLIVLTSDHGEEFGEHGGLEHRTEHLYREVTHVPLIVAGSAVPNGLRVDEPVQIIDLLPTLGELLTLEGLESDRLDGVSFGGLFAASAAGAARRPRRALTQGRGRWALRSAEWTVIENPRGRVLLFDRRADPDEHENVAEAHPSIVEDAHSAMEQMIRHRRDSTRSEEAEIDESLRRELRALGYVD